MEREFVIDINQELLKDYEKFILRKNRKKTLIRILFAVLVALYTSGWWIGIAWKNENVLVCMIGGTMITVLIFIVSVLIDDPDDPMQRVDKNNTTEESSIFQQACGSSKITDK